MEAVIFDMDGVLIDSHPAAAQLLCNTANAHGCGLTVAEIRSWGSLSSRQFWAKVKEEYRLPHELDSLIHSYNVDHEIALYPSIGLIPGVKNLLEMLKEHNVRTALATSASKKRMNAVIELFDLSKYFDQGVCDDDVKNSKPDPEIFIAAANKISVGYHQCVVIEDSQNGLLAAKAAGMKCIAFKGLSHVDENMAGSDMEITMFNEITMDKLNGLFE